MRSGLLKLASTDNLRATIDREIVMLDHQPVTNLSQRHTLRALQGFTLIELLVVLVVLAISAGLVLPTLKTAKEKGKRVVSINNTKQIVLAAQLYANDFHEILPYCGAGLPPLYTNAWCFRYEPTAAEPYQLGKGQIIPYLGSSNVFHCPAERTNDFLFSTRIVKITTYLWETTSCGGNGGKTYGPGIWNNGLGLKLSAFRANGILQIEPNENDPNCWNDGAVEFHEDETAHHNQGGIVGCYGGSAEWMSVSTWKLEQNTFPSRINCNPNAKDGKGE